MKRIISIFLSVLMLVSLFSFVSYGESAKSGDTDGNGQVNSDDAIYLLYHVYFPTDYPINGNCDFDGDGDTTSSDAIYLLYHCYFGDDYPIGGLTATEIKWYSPKYEGIASEYSAMRAKVRKWFTDSLEDNKLFSFKLGAGSALASMTKEIKSQKNSAGDEIFTVTYKTGYAEGIEAVLVATLYHDYPTVDYVVTVKNTSNAVSRKISELYALDSGFEMAKSGSYTLDTTRGSLAAKNDFEPVTKTLSSSPVSFKPQGGRSSDGAWPYFDILGNNCGLLLAIGWSGQWYADFADKGSSVYMRAKQENLSTVLMPGEQIRTPSIVLTYFDGDAEYGHNIFRRLLVANYSPKNTEDGYFVAPWCLNFWGGRTSTGINKTINALKQSEVVFDAVWMDAGWYGDFPNLGDDTNTANGSGGSTSWSTELGWWTVNKKLFPTGSLKEVSDTMHNVGSKFLLWFMIEDGRNQYASNLTFTRASYYPLASNPIVLNLSDDAVLEKVLDYFRNKMDNEGMDWIRVDFWSRPYNNWVDYDKRLSREYNGTETDRTGITENKHITNFYKLWDTLYAEYPQFSLDNCASGGRRLDIEMIKRGVALWRTDYESNDNETMQTQTEWLAKWIPFSAVGCVGSDLYHMRSLYSACGSFSTSYDGAVKNGKVLKSYLTELKDIRKYWYGDYYQLLPASSDTNSWQAYELWREDLNEGIVVVICRPDATVLSKQIKLKLNPNDWYIVSNIDDPAGAFMQSGSALVNKTGIDAKAQKKSISVYKITKM